ncbi:MAG: hypothetical protein ACFFAN_12705 [Promethearchaeota archaeon]
MSPSQDIVSGSSSQAKDCSPVITLPSTDQSHVKSSSSTSESYSSSNGSK